MKLHDKRQAEQDERDDARSDRDGTRTTKAKQTDQRIAQARRLKHAGA